MHLFLLLLLQKRARIGVTRNKGRRDNKIDCCGEVRAQQSFCDGPTARANRDAPSVSIPAWTSGKSLHDAAAAAVRLANANARLHAAADADDAVADAWLPDAVAVLAAAWHHAIPTSHVAADSRLSGLGVPATNGP